MEFAAKKKYENIRENYSKVLEFNDYLRKNVDLKNIKIISSEKGSPYILSLSAEGLKGEVVMHALETEGIIVGNGSACSSRARFSRVLEACGYNEKVLDGVIRVSFSSENTMEEIKVFTENLNRTVKKYKGIMG